jgi:hypothetical protein
MAFLGSRFRKFGAGGAKTPFTMQSQTLRPTRRATRRSKKTPTYQTRAPGSKYQVITGAHHGIGGTEGSGGGQRTTTYGYRNVASRRAKDVLLIDKLKTTPDFKRSADSRDKTKMTITNPNTGKSRILPSAGSVENLSNRVFSARRKRGEARLRNLATANRGGILV